MADCHPHSMCWYLGDPLEGLMWPFAMVCFIPSLTATLFAHPFPRHVSQCLAPILKSSLTSTLLGLLHPICTHLVHSPFPHRVLHGWLAEGSFISWVVWVLIECESPVTSAHHATHSASLALGILPPSFFFFVFSFWFCCFVGFGGCEFWPGSQPLSRLLS